MPDLALDPAFRLFAVVSLLLVLKMMAVGNYTSFLRLRRNVFATPEDYALRAATPPAVPDEDIERVRRAHRNDLENVLTFLFVGFVFVLLHPPLAAARIYLWGFLAARVLHSIFYIRSMQPHRTIAFAVGAVLMGAMIVHTFVLLAR
jgi:uncharacterized MAPEG superfamily protein